MPSPDYACSLGGDAASQLLTDHIVDITRKINLTALKPYLIQFECITLEESKRFNSDSQNENILKLIDIISKRGIGAFNGLLKALSLFTTHEQGERAHFELLETLRKAAKKYKTKRSIPLSTTSDAITTHTTDTHPNVSIINSQLETFLYFQSLL